MQLSPEMEHQRNEFLHYGFSPPPLTNEQLADLERRNIAHEFIFGIGCDVAAGVDFEVAVMLVHEIYGEEATQPDEAPELPQED